ncbi:MAG TPA: amidohydrolase [archaeon]|nr:amidohydrolase [archaeon]
MKIAFLLVPILFSGMVFACRRAQFAELVLKNGFIFTVDPGNPRAQAVAVAGNTILAVGPDREVEKFVRPGVTQVIDLQGRMVVPGFDDAHIHFLETGETLAGLNLTGITSYGRMKEIVVACVKNSRPGEWITGFGWDQSLIQEKAWPTKEILDQAAPENPVLLSRIDGHSVLVNSRALKECGITRDTPDPEGGEIVRDEATGEPTGIFKEKALELVQEPPLSPEEKEVRNIRYLRLALKEAKKYGVTSIHHLLEGGECFEQLQKSGELTVRVYLCQPLTDDREKLEEYKALKRGYENNPLIKFGALKAFMDGTLSSQTAALFEPFSDNQSTCGVLVTSPLELEEKILLADREGFQCAVHAIGTRANHLVLDAYEKVIEQNGKRDSRHRIEHVSVLIKEDVPRFAGLGVIASMQPSFCSTDARYIEKSLGRERCRYAFAWRSILSSGGRIAFSTDCPVESMDPMDGLWAAVTRQDRTKEGREGWFPEERLTVEEALELYTLGSAYASFEENIKGSIQPGKLADLVVLSNNLLEIPENEIRETKVLYTIFDGKIIYQNNHLTGKE